MKHLFTLFISSILLFSCTSKPSQVAREVEDNQEAESDTLFRVIDLANHLKPCNDSLLLSDLVKDVEYVQLETADNCLVGEINQGYVSDSAIFYSCYINPLRSHIFMFDRFSGKFIRTIGKAGQGPGEMHAPMGIRAKDGLVYLSSTYRNDLFVYKIRNGEFVRCIPLNKPYTAAQGYCIGDNRVVHFPFFGNWDGKFLLCDMSIQNFDGNIIQEHISEVDNSDFEYNNRPSSTGVALTWTYKNRPNVYSDFTDTIYTAVGDSIYPRYFISLGKYKRSPQLKVCTEWEKYIIFYGFWETKDYLVGSFGLKRKAWFFRYDKKSREIKTWEQEAETFVHKEIRGFEWRIMKAAGITNDIDGCSYSLREMKNISENQFVICITPDNIEEIRKIVKASTHVKFPEKRRQLLDMMDAMGPEDNPILVIYTFKE